MRHPHADLIHAFAEGAEIEYLYKGRWVKAPIPQWDIDTRYRIKPPETPWYEQIPEHGVLCWAGDAPEEKFIKIITHFKNLQEHKFIDSNKCGWRYATPLMDKEIKQFLRGEQ